MAYGQRFWAEFRTDPFQDGSPGALCRVQILMRDYTGPSGTLYAPDNETTMGGEPLVIDKKGKSTDNLFTPLMTTAAEFNLVTNDQWELADLFAEDERKFRVEVDWETTSGFVNIFTGYISPFDAREEYAEAPYPVHFEATCGLGSLDDYPFNNAPFKTPKIGVFTGTSILKTCLVWLGYTLPIQICLNTVEVSMMPGLATRPSRPFSVLDHVAVDTRRFLTDTGIESCYTVLTELLKPFNCTLVQDRGVWKLFRRDEYVWHVINNGAVPVVNHSAFYLDNTIYGEEISTLREVYKASEAIPHRGSTFSVEEEKKKLNIKFEYGNLKNELRNGDFREGLSYWTQSGTAFTVDGNGEEETPFGVKASGLTDNYVQRDDNVWIRQTAEFPARYGNIDTFTFGFTFININNAGAKVRVMASVQGKGVYFLQADGTWLSNGAKTIYYIFKDNIRLNNEGAGVAEAKPTKGEKVEITTSEIPGRGNYRIDVYLYRGRTFKDQSAEPAPYTIYRDVTLTKRDTARIEITGETVRINAEKLTDSTEVRRRKADEETILLGDQSSAKVVQNVPIMAPNGQITGYESVNNYYIRYGAFRRLDGNPTEKWLPYGVDPALPGNYRKIQQLCGEGRIAMMAEPATSGDITVTMRNALTDMIGPLDIVQLREKTNAGGQPISCIPLTYQWSVKKNELKFKPLEIINAAALINTKNFWEGPGGTEPMESGDNPSQPGRIVPKDYIQGVITAGKVQELLSRGTGKIVGGKGFTYNSQLGIPVGETPTSGNIIAGLQRAGKLKIFLPLPSGG